MAKYGALVATLIISATIFCSHFDDLNKVLQNGQTSWEPF